MTMLYVLRGFDREDRQIAIYRTDDERDADYQQESLRAHPLVVYVERETIALPAEREEDR